MSCLRVGRLGYLRATWTVLVLLFKSIWYHSFNFICYRCCVICQYLHENSNITLVFSLNAWSYCTCTSKFIFWYNSFGKSINKFWNRFKSSWGRFVLTYARICFYDHEFVLSALDGCSYCAANVTCAFINGLLLLQILFFHVACY